MRSDNGCLDLGIEALFSPFRLKTLDLKNRFVMAPMTRQHSPGNIPNQENVDYYARRSLGEVGLILTEGTAVERPGRIHYLDVPYFYGDNALTGWRNVVHAVHLNGGKIAPQLWHVGLTARDPKGREGPADLEGPANMSIEDIHSTISAFGKAAVHAKCLGFDAIEVHGAHGYLIDQFFSGVTNRRTDEYGGKTIQERNRFATDVLKAIRNAVGPDMVVILRLSQWKLDSYEFKLVQNPQEMEEWLIPLAEAGADIFHLSQRRFWEPAFHGSDLNVAGWAKKITGCPTITVGSVGISSDGSEESTTLRDLSELQRRFERGDFDLVALGRSILSDPMWVKKIRENRINELNGFTKASLKAYF